MKKIAIIIAGITLAAFAFYALKIGQFWAKIYTPKNGKHVFTTPIPEKTEFSILLLGYAGGRYAGTYLTDTIIVLNIDLEKKKATMVSLPRDLWVKLPTKSGDDFHVKINTLYEIELFPKTYPDLDTKKAGNTGDAELTKFILSQITGLEISNYISIDFDSFIRAIDILGGLDINVTRSFEDLKYPAEGKEDELCGKDEQFKEIEPYLGDKEYKDEDKEKLIKEKPELEQFLQEATKSPHLAFPCRYEKVSFAKGEQHMDGKTALKFARSRQAPQDGGDFARARRQQQVIEAVKAKVFSVGFISKIPSLLEELDEYVKTDIGTEEAKRFSKEIPSAGNYKLSSIVLSDENVLDFDRSNNGQSILVPESGENDWESVQEFIKNSIAGITPSPTREPTKKTSPTNKN